LLPVFDTLLDWDEEGYRQRDVGGCRNTSAKDGEVQSAQVIRRPLREHTAEDMMKIGWL